SRFLSEIPPELVRVVEKERAVWGGSGSGGYAEPWRTVPGSVPVDAAGFVPPLAPRILGKTEHAPIAIDAGDTVYHDRFGEGVVLEVRRSGEEALINFHDVGEKTLRLAYAPLEKRPS